MSHTLIELTVIICKDINLLTNSIHSVYTTLYSVDKATCVIYFINTSSQ